MYAQEGGANTTPYFSAEHFAKRNTKFGGGKRGRAKIPSPQPPSFLPTRAFSFCRAKRGNQSGFFSKKVRASFSNCVESEPDSPSDPVTDARQAQQTEMVYPRQPALDTDPLVVL